MFMICDGDHLRLVRGWLTFCSATEKPPNRDSDEGYSSYPADYASCNGSCV